MKIDLKFCGGELHIERDPIDLGKLQAICGILYAAIASSGINLFVFILKNF